MRVALVQKTPAVWGDFIKGRNILLRDGGFGDKKTDNNYNRACTKLTKLVMDRARVVFCTTAAIRNRALRWTVTEEKGKDKEGKPEYEVKVMTWEPTTLIMDEAAAANQPELLLPMATFKSLMRVIWGGDHKQLPPFLLTELAKNLWLKTWFERLIERHWPCVQLRLQYRAHDGLMHSPNIVFYGGALESAHKTDNPRLFLQLLLNALPLIVRSEELHSKRYDITAYTNFIDVAHGQEEGPSPGSKRNLAEVRVIMGILKALRGIQNSTGAHMSLSNVAVITGYLSQEASLKESLQAAHQADQQFGWGDVKLITSGKVQGGEYNVVIVSLVKTQGSRGFLGDKNRACVLTTRPREAMYYVGNWDFWKSPNQSGYKALDQTFYNLRDTARKLSRAPFVVYATNET